MIKTPAEFEKNLFCFPSNTGRLLVMILLIPATRTSLAQIEKFLIKLKRRNCEYQHINFKSYKATTYCQTNVFGKITTRKLLLRSFCDV